VILKNLNVINNEGFDRLPRRSLSIRKQAGSAITIEAPKSELSFLISTKSMATPI
jgi:hypothetical protein